MSKIISSGQITIIDLHDAPVLNAWISAKLLPTQTYNNTTGTYSPNYATETQELTLNLTKAGSSTLITTGLTNLKWMRREGTSSEEQISTTSTSADEYLSTGNRKLHTKKNTSTASNAVVWTVTGTWSDASTGLDVDFSATITTTLVQLAKAAIIPNIYAPNGDFFRNDTPSSLDINADLYKDGALATTNKRIRWFAADSSISTAQDPEAGIGWRLITSTSATTIAKVNVAPSTATHKGQGVLTAYPDGVTNSQTFLVIINDNALGAGGPSVKQYYTLRDMDDPIMVVVESTNGNIFKNGVGNSTTLRAQIYRNGEIIDEGPTYAYDYYWTKWVNGSMVTNFGGTGNQYKTGKELTVTDADVSVKATFKVEVRTK